MAPLEVERPRSFSKRTSSPSTHGTLPFAAAGNEPTAPESADPEEILYEAVHGREALHLGGGFEAPHLAFVLARRLTGDFSAIDRVLILTWTTDDIMPRRAAG